jgi:RimJ/RimL family protein N-acetyltransferase
MEKMPYRSDLDPARLPMPIAEAPDASDDWRSGLPSLAGAKVTLRELRVGDAPALFSALSSEQVARFISPPPATVDGFERFIAWAHRQRAAGQYVCFAVVPNGSETPIGIYQVRSLEPAFGTAEWGFAIDEEFWGSGVFADGARLVVDFAIDVLRVHRLEARAALANGRGNGALRKVGAVREVVLRRSFLRSGEYLDQALWTILADEWRAQAPVPDSPVIH